MCEVDMFFASNKPWCKFYSYWRKFEKSKISSVELIYVNLHRMAHAHFQPAKMTYKSWICYRATIEFREVSNVVDDENVRFLVGKWKNNRVTDKESCIFVILYTHGVSYIYNDIVFWRACHWEVRVEEAVSWASDFGRCDAPNGVILR